MMPDFEIPDAPAEKPGRLAGAFRLCVAGPDCVRICTRAFDPSYPPSFDPVPGLRQFSRGRAGGPRELAAAVA